jgi:hypothetical protein
MLTPVTVGSIGEIKNQKRKALQSRLTAWAATVEVARDSLSIARILVYLIYELIRPLGSSEITHLFIFCADR